MDFWQKQSLIPGQDCETICGGSTASRESLDDEGGSEANSGSGPAYGVHHDPKGLWCITTERCRSRCVDVVPEAEYGEHGPFDYAGKPQRGGEIAMACAGYCLDTRRLPIYIHDQSGSGNAVQSKKL